MKVAICGLIVGSLLVLSSVREAAAFYTNPGCRGTFGYDKNGKKHCNLAEWEAQQAAKSGKKKK